MSVALGKVPSVRPKEGLGLPCAGPPGVCLLPTVGGAALEPFV